MPVQAEQQSAPGAREVVNITLRSDDHFAVFVPHAGLDDDHAGGADDERDIAGARPVFDRQPAGCTEEHVDAICNFNRRQSARMSAWGSI